MIKKLLVSCLMFLGFINTMHGQEKDVFSVYFDYVHPSRAFLQKATTGSLVSGIPDFYGAGVSFNQISIGWSDYFFDGGRATLRYNFKYQKIVSPYLAVDYIYGTNAEMKQGTKTRRVDGVSPSVGINMNFYQILQPYVQYQILEGYLLLGVRVALPITTRRISPQDAINQVEEQYIKEQLEEEQRRADAVKEKEEQINKKKSANQPKTVKRKTR